MVDIQYNKKDLVIIGAGGMGREIATWFSNSNLTNQYELKGYLDDDKRALLHVDNAYSIIGDTSEDNYVQQKNLVIGLASSPFKKDLIAKQKVNGQFSLVTFIHNSVIVGADSTMGIGVVVCPNSIVSCNVKLEDGVFINSGSQIGHDVIVGEYSSLMATVNIGGGAKIGKNVFVGTGAVILPGIEIADNTKIAAGAVVFRNIRKPGTYLGNPATLLM
jgi:sugar O-acyltransferase (sialic acid O-acetyltransferase NeuD family)